MCRNIPQLFAACALSISAGLFFSARVSAAPLLPAATDSIPLQDPIPGSITPGEAAIRIEPVFSGLVSPIHATFAPGHDGHLVVVDQPGIAWMIEIVGGEATRLLDVSSRLVRLGIQGPGSFDERGLLGIAFHPQYAVNGRLYTCTSEPDIGTADFANAAGFVNHQSVIAEWQVLDPTDPGTMVNLLSRRELLRIDQPQFNHNAGNMLFGPDGFLYIALGDGGGGDDQGNGHGSTGNGQDIDNPLGAVLRIDVEGDNSDNGQYGIPADNPFVGGIAGLDEIYAYGLRNPYRMSFDRETGELYVADVGQNDIEEINLVEAGGNYGWNEREGSFGFEPNGDRAGFVFQTDAVTQDTITPLAEYDHDEGISIIGGYVNRGPQAAQVLGNYVFGDFERRLFYLDGDAAVRELRIENRPGGFGESVLGFGESGSGELFVLSNQHGILSGTTGKVHAIRSAITRGTPVEFIQLAYLSYYGRPADPGGLAFWADRLSGVGGDLSDLIDAFGNSPEFVERFGSLSNVELVNNVFVQLFGRDADAAGLEFFEELLTSGERSLQSIALDVLNGAQRDDVTVIANKLAAAQRFTDLVESTGFAYTGSEVADTVKQLFDDIGVDVQSGLDAVDVFIAENTGAAGQ